MDVGIAVIGAGMMGADHALRIAREIKGARLAAVSDVDAGRAQDVIDRAASEGALATSDPVEAINSPSVEAVIIAAPDAFHAPLTLEALRAGKPVLCEKPLAPSSKECLEVLEFENQIAGSSNAARVSLGFMRRFDPACLELKATLDQQRFGPALMVHCVHRNMVAYPGGSEHTVNASAVHEFDFIPWLLNSPIASISWHAARSSGNTHRQDPQLMLLETASGVLITLEMFVSAQYGYEVRCEMVCESGTSELNDTGWTVERHNGQESRRFPPDSTLKYSTAYSGELRAWLATLTKGLSPEQVGLASAWDGYTAAVVAEAAIESMRAADGRRVPVAPGDASALYA
jgi:myo-inositol 2-dehydrogenase/D-chiro-inositol 1-dehydrogenase